MAAKVRRRRACRTAKVPPCPSPKRWATALSPFGRAAKPHLAFGLWPRAQPLTDRLDSAPPPTTPLKHHQQTRASLAAQLWTTRADANGAGAELSTERAQKPSLAAFACFARRRETSRARRRPGCGVFALDRCRTATATNEHPLERSDQRPERQRPAGGFGVEDLHVGPSGCTRDRGRRPAFRRTHSGKEAYRSGADAAG